MKLDKAEAKRYREEVEAVCSNYLAASSLTGVQRAPYIKKIEQWVETLKYVEEDNEDITMAKRQLLLTARWELDLLSTDEIWKQFDKLWGESADIKYLCDQFNSIWGSKPSLASASDMWAYLRPDHTSREATHIDVRAVLEEADSTTPNETAIARAMVERAVDILFGAVLVIKMAKAKGATFPSGGRLGLDSTQSGYIVCEVYGERIFKGEEYPNGIEVLFDSENPPRLDATKYSVKASTSYYKYTCIPFNEFVKKYGTYVRKLDGILA